jgi:Amt family ammonium transporter
MVQLYSVGITVGWTALISFIILKAIQATSGIRISEQDELDGLDVTQHGERAYHHTG